MKQIIEEELIRTSSILLLRLAWFLLEEIQILEKELLIPAFSRKQTGSCYVIKADKINKRKINGTKY